jgi:hypothetical membrane protein
MRLIAIVSLLFFVAGALGLALLSSVLPLRHDDAFLLDIFLSIVFFQLFARRVIAWRSVAREDSVAASIRG